jgi:hypothetical protein
MPSDDMFFDDAHLNTKKGIPSIVKFLKRVLNIPNTQTRRPSLSDSEPHIHGKNSIGEPLNGGIGGISGRNWLLIMSSGGG